MMLNVSCATCTARRILTPLSGLEMLYSGSLTVSHGTCALNSGKNTKMRALSITASELAFPTAGVFPEAIIGEPLRRAMILAFGHVQCGLIHLSSASTLSIL